MGIIGATNNIEAAKTTIVETILIASPTKNQANVPLPVEPAAGVLKENQANIAFGSINAKPPKTTEYTNSILANTKNRSAHTTTVTTSINNIL